MANEGVNLATAHTTFTADFSSLTEGIKHAVKVAQDGANRIKQEFAEIEKAGQRAANAFTGNFTHNINITVRSVLKVGTALLGVAETAVKTGATIGSALSTGIRTALTNWNALHNTFMRTTSQMRMRLVFFKLDLEFLATGIRRIFLGIGGALGAFTSAAVSFESAFVTVRRVVDETEAGFAQLNKNIREMSKELPIGANELANLMSVAGRMGIRGVDNLTKFTDTIAKLQMTTDIVGEDAAAALAQLLNVMDEAPANIDRVGSTIVDLGNNFAATEMNIVNMATRIAGAGRVVGLSTADVLGLATALAQAGVRAEMGGSAISRVMINMSQAVANGSKEVRTFAEVAGMSTRQWVDLFRTDPVRAIEAFIRGLRRMDDAGQNVFATLEAVGMTEIRTRDALLRLVGASDKMSEAIDRANWAWRQNTALTNEVEEALNTTGAQTRILWNELVDVARGIGDQLQPVLRNLIDVARTVLSVFENLTDEQKKNIAQWTVLAGVITGVGMALMTAVHIILTTVLSLVLIVQALTTVTNPLFIGFMAILFIVGLVKKAFEENWGGIADKFVTFTQKISEAVEALKLDQLAADLKTHVDEIKNIWASDLTLGEKIVETGKVIVKIGKTLWQWAKEAYDTLLDAFLARWGEEGKDFENMTTLEKTLEAVKVVFSAIVSGLQIVWGGLVRGYDKLLDWFLDNWDEEVPEDERPASVLGKTLRVAKIVFDALVQALKIVWGGVLKGYNAVLDWFLANWDEELPEDEQPRTTLEKTIRVGQIIFRSLVDSIKIVWGGIVKGYNALLDWFLANWDEELPEDEQPRTTLEKTIRVGQIILSALVDSIKVVWGGIVKGYNALLDWLLANWDEELPEDEQPRTTLEKTIRVGQIILNALVDSIKVVWGGIVKGYNAVLDWFLTKWDEELPEDEQPRTTLEKTIRVGQITLSAIVNAVKIGWEWLTDQYDSVLDMLLAYWGKDDEEIENLTLPKKTIKAVSLAVTEVVGLVDSIIGWFLNETINLTRDVAVSLGIDWENSNLGRVIQQIQDWWNREDVTLAEKIVGLVGISITGFYIVQGTRDLLAMIGQAITRRLAAVGLLGLGAAAKGFAIKVALPAVAITGLGIVFMEPEALSELREAVQEGVDGLKSDLQDIWGTFFKDLNAEWNQVIQEGRLFDPITLIVQNVADTIAAVRKSIQPIKEFLENQIAKNLGKINLVESFRKGLESGELDVAPRVVGFFSSMLDLGIALANTVKEGFLLGFDLLSILTDIFLAPLTGIAATIMDVGAQLAGHMIAGFQQAWEWFADRFVSWFKNSSLGRLLISLGFMQPDEKDAVEQASKMSPEDRAALSGLRLQAMLIEREMILDANRDRLDELSQQLAEIEAQIESILSKYAKAVKPEGIAFVRPGETVLTEYSSAQIEAMVRTIAEKSGYNPDLAVAMALAESTLRDVINREGSAWGPLQVTSSAIADLKRLGYSVDMDTIEGRIQAGLDYINVLLTQYADTVQGLAERLNISLHDAVILAYMYGPTESRKKQTLTDADRRRLERAYGMQHGGIIPGLAGADQYHVMVAPGEAIVPSQAVRRGWPGVLEWFRKKNVPGFQAGRAPNVPSSIADQINPTMEAAVQLRESVQEMSKTLVDALERSMGWLGSIFMSGIELLVRLLESLFPEQADAFRDVIENLKNLWSAMWERETRRPVPKELLYPPVPTPPPRPETPLSPWERLINRIQEIWEKSVDWIRERWDKAITWVGERLEEGVSFIADAKEWFGKPLEERTEDLKNAFATVALRIMDFAAAMPEILGQVATGIAIFSQTLVGKVPGLAQAINTYQNLAATQNGIVAATVAVFELLEANSEELSSSLRGLMVPIKIVAAAFGDALAPVLEALWPVFKALGIVSLTVLEGVGTVWNALVSTISGIFETLANLKILGRKPFEFLQGVADFFNKLKVDTNALSKAKKELTELTLDEAKALKDTTDKVREFGANVPSIFKRALRVFQSSEGIPALASGGYVPATPGGRIVRLAEGGQGEYVIPESKMGWFGGPTIVVNVDLGNAHIYGVDDLDDRIKRNVGEAIRDAAAVLTGA